MRAEKKDGIPAKMEQPLFAWLLLSKDSKSSCQPVGYESYQVASLNNVKSCNFPPRQCFNEIDNFLINDVIQINMDGDSSDKGSAEEVNLKYDASQVIQGQQIRKTLFTNSNRSTFRNSSF